MPAFAKRSRYRIDTLPATVAMMNKPALIGWAAGIKCLLKCIENKAGLGRTRRFRATNGEMAERARS